VLDTGKVLDFFLPDAQLPAGLTEVLRRMGELGMGFRELEMVSGVSPPRLRALFSARVAPAKAASDVAVIKQALHLG
jgi:hypothetical protein